MSGNCLRYTIELDEKNIFNYEFILVNGIYRLNHSPSSQTPTWTKLSFEKCPNCPLNERDSPVCPAADVIALIAEDVASFSSYEMVKVIVEIDDKITFAETSLQRTLSSLIGILMASSDCPHFQYLRPMARFHQPLATPLETVYRAVSMYTLAQYFIIQDNGSPDLSLKGLNDIYDNLQIVNKSMANRLRSVSPQDSSVNAVVLLDLFAKEIPYSIEESLSELKDLFQAYL